MLDHGEAKALIVDPEFAPVMAKALQLRKRTEPLLIDPGGRRPVRRGRRAGLGSIRYEDFVAQGDAAFAWELPEDEWDAIALNYTSGTTGNPKGVVYHHRGAAINAISNVLEWDMPKHSVYLWTLAHVPLQWLVLPLDRGGPRRRQRLPAPGRGQGHL